MQALWSSSFLTPTDKGLAHEYVCYGCKERCIKIVLDIDKSPEHCIKPLPVQEDI